jgi:hypothetical protein
VGGKQSMISIIEKENKRGQPLLRRCKKKTRKLLVLEKQRLSAALSSAAMSVAGGVSARVPVFHAASLGASRARRGTPVSSKLRVPPRRGATSVACVAMAPPQSTARTVLALDFDGVVCDSEPESSISGWKHGLELWPAVFSDQTQYDRVLAGLRELRPVVETGFENTLLARCVLQRTYPTVVVLENWGKVMPQLMEQWGLDRGEMVAGYGRVRDEWMERDLQGWLAPNEIYPGVGEAVLLCENRCGAFPITTYRLPDHSPSWTSLLIQRKYFPY